jgi:hypothetical protein
MRRLTPFVAGLALVALFVGACGGASGEPEAELPKLIYFYADW